MVVALLLFSIAVTGVLATPPKEENTTLQTLIESNVKFTGAIYKEVLQSTSKNFVVSSFSIEDILALVRLGSRGKTAQEISNVLYLPDKEEDIEASFKSIIPKLRNEDAPYSLNLANKIYLREGVKINPNFSKRAQEAFGTALENINFIESQIAAASSINRWVEQQTDHKIQNIIQPENLTPRTQVILVNALYFSGKWEKRFLHDSTVKKPFYKSNSEKVNVSMMHLEDEFNYYECSILDAKILNLPYEGGEITMTIILPNRRDGLRRLLDHSERLFRTPKYSFKKVHIEIPKFSIESKIDLNNVLQKLGIKTAFKNEANLSGIAECEKDLKISEIIQKTFVNVTEDGTKAAVVTAAFGAVPLSVPAIEELLSIKSFIADHPFLFYVRSPFGILFFGHYVEP